MSYEYAMQLFRTREHAIRYALVDYATAGGNNTDPQACEYLTELGNRDGWEDCVGTEDEYLQEWLESVVDKRTGEAVDFAGEDFEEVCALSLQLVEDYVDEGELIS